KFCRFCLLWEPVKPLLGNVTVLGEGSLSTIKTHTAGPDEITWRELVHVRSDRSYLAYQVPPDDEREWNRSAVRTRSHHLIDVVQLACQQTYEDLSSRR